MTLTPPVAGNEARSTDCSTEKSQLEANAARANAGQIDRSKVRRCAAIETHKTEGTPYL